MTDGQRVVANKLAKQREYFTHLAPIRETDKTKTVCFSLETTGVNNELDEVLETIILSGNFNVLLNTYVKPIFTTSWKSVEAVHHISYNMVENKPTLQQLVPLIKGMFDDADVIVGYNGSFNLGFLEGLYSLENKRVINVTELFVPIYGKVSEKCGGYEWRKLQNCVDYFGYKLKTYGSYEDAEATLYCCHKIAKRKEV